MTEFEAAALERVRVARALLVAAREAEDVFEESLAAGELEDALRLAREHGIAVPETDTQ
ncbi:hypothetical protein ACH4SP_04150 [Streptomyces sp. NPDC021093]|uniref:hypothetical protein n=1 Tax=Streptomyces sp. NPDC021093 TaxID=3365112 RepID=UPI0037BDA6B6